MVPMRYPVSTTQSHVVVFCLVSRWLFFPIAMSTHSRLLITVAEESNDQRLPVSLRDSVKSGSKKLVQVSLVPLVPHLNRGLVIFCCKRC